MSANRNETSTSAPITSADPSPITHRRHRLGFLSHGPYFAEMWRRTNPPGPRNGMLQNLHLGLDGRRPNVLRPMTMCRAVPTRHARHSSSGTVAPSAPDLPLRSGPATIGDDGPAVATVARGATGGGSGRRRGVRVGRRSDARREQHRRAPVRPRRGRRPAGPVPLPRRRRCSSRRSASPSCSDASDGDGRSSRSRGDRPHRGASRVALATGADWIYPALWLLRGASEFLLGLAVWGLAGLVTDTRQAKRFFPLIGGAAVLGQVLAGLATTSARGLARHGEPDPRVARDAGDRRGARPEARREDAARALLPRGDGAPRRSPRCARASATRFARRCSGGCRWGRSCSPSSSSPCTSPSRGPPSSGTRSPTTWPGSSACSSACRPP